MYLNQLKYVVEVAEKKSINKAAQSLFISQPNLSTAIINLEEEFGIKIFNRTNRGVELTKDGKEFLSHAKYVLHQVDNLESRYLNFSKEKSFILEVSSAKIINFGNIISEIYNNIDSKNIKISLKETYKEKIIKDVANMESEIGILIVSNIQERLWKNALNINKLEFNEIIKSSMYICVGPKSPLYNNKIVSSKDLKDYAHVQLREEDSSSVANSIELDTLNILNKNKNIYLNDKESLTSFILSTDSYTFGFKWSSFVESSNDIKAIPFEDDSVYFKIGWLRRKKEEISDEARIFLDKVIDYLKDKNS